MSSGQFDTVVTVLRDGEVVGNNDDGDGDNNTNSRLEVELQPGTYEVLATAYDGGSGTYRLEAARR